jgi:hypothetical protein
MEGASLRGALRALQLEIVLLNSFFMSTDKNQVDQTFANEDSWAIQCLTLAALGMLSYVQIAEMVMSA